jgi:predicted small metal-binding protein
VQKEKIEKLCDDLGFLCSFETSAKENIGIDESIKFLITKVCHIRFSKIKAQKLMRKTSNSF